MKDRLVHDPPVAEVLDDDPLEEGWRNACVPDAFRVDHHDRPASAYAEARRLTALHTSRSEEQILAFEQPGEQTVERASSAIRRTESTSADEHVATIRFHVWLADSSGRHDKRLVRHPTSPTQGAEIWQFDSW
jgi:hypothetical protein